MKVVINTCFGGFGLSHEGVMEYARLAGFELYPFTEKRDAAGNYDFKSHTFVPYTVGMAAPLGLVHYSKQPLDAEGRYPNDSYFSDGDISRNDANLVKVVETLGKKSFGHCAELSIVEIPDGVAWQVEEYDGNEHIAETHRTWR